MDKKVRRKNPKLFFCLSDSFRDYMLCCGMAYRKMRSDLPHIIFYCNISAFIVGILAVLLSQKEQNTCRRTQEKS
ncbi:MAG: hypothetical protein MJ168_07645 [Clostridia bacterium]|nr:hypothetical protein [Clostridia bacterium]